jgi:Protein of unknown function (DUF3644)
MDDKHKALASADRVSETLATLDAISTPTTLSAELGHKSVDAVIAAIEVYNKPNFSYREEAFAILMTNAWELLLKAKWLLDHDEAIESLYEDGTDSTGAKIIKKNRSGNPLTLGTPYLAAKLLEDPDSGLERGCNDNILALIEIRDNATHFINKDLYIGRRVLEIGTASLRNYMLLAQEWLQIDLSKYNFFLMPISFYHGFESAEPVSRAHYPEQIQRLLKFIDQLEAADDEEESIQHVALRLETKLVRGKDATSVAFRWTDDPKCPAIAVRDEDFRKNYPFTYRELTNALKRRYSNFSENDRYHTLRRTLEKETKFAFIRILDPSNPKSNRKTFYNANIMPEFDKHYERRKKEIGASPAPITTSQPPDLRA